MWLSSVRSLQPDAVACTKLLTVVIELLDDTNIAIDQLGKFGCSTVCTLVLTAFVIHELGVPCIDHLRKLATECFENAITQYTLAIRSIAM